LLALTRPTRPQIKVLDVNRLSEEIHRFLRRVLPATIDFQLDLEPRPATLAGDPGQMQQVLINLCLNARDAMPAGGILRIQTRVVGRADLPAHVKPTAEADRFVRVRVSDNGSGMDADTLRQIFDPFFTTKSKDRGTGLGLAIVYKIVEVHKGAIDVASRPDEGTQFDIYFPFVERVEDPPVETAPAGGQEQVLIVDDEEMIASLMRTLLEGRGYRVQVAHRPEQAVALACEPGRKLDLAVVDFQLPDSTGDQCLAELRKTHPGLRAILVTGDTSALPEMNDPRTRVLSKPFTANALTDAVRELLRQSDGVNPASA
ncbi:MAG: response regulator, partial [Phycisphaerae bacterium]